MTLSRGANPEPVIVIGETPIARFLIEILLAKGISPIAVADSEPWLNWLATKGVAAARDRAALTEALAAQSLGTRPWRMICGDPAAARIAVELARPRSMLTVLASAPVAIGGLLAREVAIVGVAGAHPDLVVEAAAMCVKGEIDLIRGTSENASDPLRTHVRTSH